MKPTLISILIFANVCLVAANLYLIFEVHGLKASHQSNMEETVKRVRAEFDEALSPQAMTARFGDEAGKSMQAFQQSLATYYEELSVQAQQTAENLRAAAEPMIQEMRTKTSEMGQTIGASTQQFGKAIEQQAKDLNKNSSD